jgi:hypothetical protein
MHEKLEILKNEKNKSFWLINIIDMGISEIKHLKIGQSFL